MRFLAKGPLWFGSRTIRPFRAVVLFVLLSFPTLAYAALTIEQESTLRPSDSMSDDDFGGAVAVAVNTAVVGAPEQTVLGETKQGAVYVYIRDEEGNWTEQAKLLGSDSDSLDHLGSSVAISGNTLVAGGGVGQVAYVFVRTAGIWTEQQKLTDTTVGSSDAYGGAVAISGDTIVIGARRGDEVSGSMGPGVAIVFTRTGSTWTRQAYLSADDGLDGDEFGRSVAIDGDLIVVGASARDSGELQNTGVAYVFRREGALWFQEARLDVPEITAFDALGWSVDVSGNRALIGARSGDGVTTSSGSAYVFLHDGAGNWSLEDVLFPADEAAVDAGGSRFGSAVSLLGDVALIGAPRTDQDEFNGNGAAYVFQRVGSSWPQERKVRSRQSLTLGEFGGAVALSGDTLLVGASEQFSTFVGLNAAYPYDYELTSNTNGPIVSAILPSSRSVQDTSVASAFAVIVNGGTNDLVGCEMEPLTGVFADFSYQTTDPATNASTGSADVPVNIIGGGAQNFVITFTPTLSFGTREVLMHYDCDNSAPAQSIVGVNSIILSASSSPVPDIVALAATINNDGIVNLPGSSGGVDSTGVFSVAISNVGATGNIDVTADTGGATFPVDITLCQTVPLTGACMGNPSPTVSLDIDASSTATFGLFVEGLGQVAFAPAINRVFVRFEESLVIRGSTSVAVRTP